MKGTTMHDNIREALRQLVNTMGQALLNRLQSIELLLHEDLIKGHFHLTSTACPYSLRIRYPAYVVEFEPVILQAEVIYDSGDVEASEEAMLEGHPTIRFPLGLVDLKHEDTYEHLLSALETYHPFTSARHLRLFSLLEKRA